MTTLGITLGDRAKPFKPANLREFGEWLRAFGTHEQAMFGWDILSALDTLEAMETALQTAGMGSIPDPVKGIETLDQECRWYQVDAARYDEMRTILVECGALAADDTSTPLPALLRALVSL